MYQKLVLNCLWGPCVQNRVLVQRNMPLLCETLYRVHADVPPPLLCWSLAPHPLPSACHRDSKEWIHSKRSQRRTAAQLNSAWTRLNSGIYASKTQTISLGCSALCFIKITKISTTRTSCIGRSIWSFFVCCICCWRFHQTETEYEMWAGRRSLLSSYRVDKETMIVWIHCGGKWNFWMELLK